MSDSLSLVIPLSWPANGHDPTTAPVSYALTPGEAGQVHPGDWQEASWEGQFPRLAGPKPPPGRWAIWFRTSEGVRMAGYLDVTDTG